MTAKLLPPKVAKFVRNNWSSPEMRRMFICGQVITKLSAMFQLNQDEEIPDEAKAACYLMIEGLESGNPVEYARCDELAMDLYRSWLASREVH